MKTTFPKRLRLRKRWQFSSTQRKGTRYHTSSLIAYYTPNSNRPIRLGITVSRKVGKAHQRNRIKRLIREAFRTSELRHQSGFNLVVIAKKETPPHRLSSLRDELREIACKAHSSLARSL